MAGDEPPRSVIVTEVIVYVLLFVLVGAAFVAWRALREGPRVLDYDVRSPK